MATIDRSKFKNLSAPVADTQAADKQLQDQLGYKKGFSGIHDIEEGLNTFRIYPPHPKEMGGGVEYAQPKVTTFLPIMVQETDKDKNPIMEGGRPKMKKVQKPIFNSRIHGGTPKDLVDEYIAFAKKHADQKWPNAASNAAEKTAKSNFLDHIYGKYNDNPAFRISGITYQTTWVMYADKIAANGTKTFDRLEIKKSVRDRMNAIAAIESKGDPLGTDPFTDIDNGRPITILFNKAAAASSKYMTDIDNTTEKEMIGERAVQVMKNWALTDEEIEHWLAQKPLNQLLGPTAFKTKDFMMQYQGLQLFDETNGFGIMADPEFLAVVEEIAAYFPEDEEVDDEPQEESEEQNAATTDRFDLMTRDELKKEIKVMQLGIVVKPTMNDESLRGLLREHESASQETSQSNAVAAEPQPEQPKNDDFAKELSELKPPVIEKKTSRLDALKSKMAK